MSRASRRSPVPRPAPPSPDRNPGAAAIEAAVTGVPGALVLFLTAGYPCRDETPGLLSALDRGGADVLEVGLPFSDSLADGPVVQASYHRSIADGTTWKRALDQLREVRRDLSAPVVLMGSVNPLLCMGAAAFAARARASGASGVLVPDLPPEHAAEVREAVTREGLAWIPLAAPNTPIERYPLLGQGAGGFLYQITRTGTTGARRGRLPPGLAPRVEAARAATGLPVALGFGIGTRAQVREAWRIADAAVVGSALLQVLDGADTRTTRRRVAGEFAAELSGRPRMTRRTP